MASDMMIRGNLVLPDGVLTDGCLIVRDGQIRDISTADSLVPTHDYRGQYVAPGYIDLHIHGLAGADVMDGTPEAIETMARAALRHGVTSFLPTTVTQSLDATERAVSAVRQFMSRDADALGAQVVGMHLEGPWISKDAKGAQNGDYIIHPDPQSVTRLLDAAAGVARIVTVAPELTGFDWAMDAFRKHQVKVSIGHTTASYELAMDAFAAGATRVTHCFNAMTGLHHRNPGVVGATFLAEDILAELIADGFHVHPAAMRLMVKVKGHQRIMLVTDAMRATDMPEGNDYDLGGQRIIVRDGQARLENGALAGSVLSMDRAVKNMVELCDVPVHEAVFMASATPADSIGLSNQKGRLAPGLDADLIVLQPDLTPVHQFVSHR